MHRVAAVLSLISFVLVGAVLFPLWKPLMLGAVLAGTLWGWHEKLAVRMKQRRALSAALFVLAVFLLVLLPIAGIVTYAVREATMAVHFIRDALQGASGIADLRHLLPDRIEALVDRALKYVPEDLSLPSTTTTGQAVVGALQSAFGALSRLAFDLVLALLAAYFLLVDGSAFVAWLERAIPLPGKQLNELLTAFRQTAQAVLGSTLMVATVQGVVATIGYLITQVPQPIFFGLTTWFAAFIPAAGTALVALPLAGLLFLTGHAYRALFLLIWCFGVVGMVDNLLKPVFIKRGGVKMHGAVIFFSLLGGLMFFGPMGFLIGPLSITFFLTVARVNQGESGSSDVSASSV
jgi:predicted PurR-regulated permease PerM